MSDLEARRDRLYERLQAGYERIERALGEGRDIARWEDFWLELLAEYEQVCIDIQRAAPAGPSSGDDHRAKLAATKAANKREGGR